MKRTDKEIIMALPIGESMNKTSFAKYVANRVGVCEDSAFKCINKLIKELRKNKMIGTEQHGRYVHYEFTGKSIRYLKEVVCKKEFARGSATAQDFERLLSSVWVTGSTINWCGNLHR